jgi:hypothetical protein
MARLRQYPGLRPLPADQTLFACFLAEQGLDECRYSQTKARICAIRAISALSSHARTCW